MACILIFFTYNFIQDLWFNANDNAGSPLVELQSLKIESNLKPTNEAFQYNLEYPNGDWVDSQTRDTEFKSQLVVRLFWTRVFGGWGIDCLQAVLQKDINLAKTISIKVGRQKDERVIMCIIGKLGRTEHEIDDLSKEGSKGVNSS